MFAHTPARFFYFSLSTRVSSPFHQESGSLLGDEEGCAYESLFAFVVGSLGGERAKNKETTKRVKNRFCILFFCAKWTSRLGFSEANLKRDKNNRRKFVFEIASSRCVAFYALQCGLTASRRREGVGEKEGK